MIQATKEHHLTLDTTDQRTDGLANMIHNMHEWLHKKIITKQNFVHIHDILRGSLDTENFLSVVGYRDEREDNNEYAIRVIEFPVKSDGSIRSFTIKDEKFFMLTEEEAEEARVAVVAQSAFDAIDGIENNTDKKERK